MKTHFTENGKAAIEQILRLMEEASKEFAKLSAEEDHQCFDFHNEGTSLNHCIRWGLQAAKEIHEEIGSPSKPDEDTQYIVASTLCESNAGWAIRARNEGLKVTSGAPQSFGACHYLVRDNKDNWIEFVQMPSQTRKLDAKDFSLEQKQIVQKLIVCGILKKASA